MAPDPLAGSDQHDAQVAPATPAGATPVGAASTAATPHPLVSSRVLILLAAVLAIALLITVVASLLSWQLPEPVPVSVPSVPRA
jgi:hypothetical protein